MQRFRLLFITSAATLALMGCNASGGGGGDSTVEITSKNADTIINNTLTDLAQDDTASDPFTSFNNQMISGSTQSKSLDGRTQTSIACDSGSATVNVSGDTVGDGSEPANGSASYTASYDNCVFSSTTSEYSFSMTIDGSMDVQLSWTGFDGSNFSSFAMSVDLNNFYMNVNFDGEVTEFEADYKMDMSFNGSVLAIDYSGSMNFDSLGDGTVTISTVETVKTDISTGDNYPDSGKVVVEGANGSNITYTVVANGVEVSVNGGQATLYTWTEIESMD